MGFRFQKRIRVLPGLTINLSKSGISTSIGVRGARITRGHGKTRVTVGVPGSGLSHSTVSSNRRRGGSGSRDGAGGFPRWMRLIGAGAVLVAGLALVMKLFS